MPVEQRGGMQRCGWDRSQKREDVGINECPGVNVYADKSCELTCGLASWCVM